MIVFVEGADGAGKTTLVNELKAYYPTISITRAAQSVWPSIWSDLHEASRNKIFVADRCFISDYVYRLHDLEQGDYDMSDLLKYLLPNAIIYCKTDTQYEDAMLRGEDNITNKDDANDIRNLYDVIMRIFVKEDIPLMCYNWKEQNIFNVLDFIKDLKEVNKDDSDSV